MYARICLGVLCSFLSFGIMARTIALDVTFDAYVEAAELDIAAVKVDGWTVEEGDFEHSIFRLKIELEESDIPFARWLDNGAYIKIDKNFVLEMGISVGDADAGATASFELPRVNGQLSPLPPITLDCTGGDYASGWWSFWGKAVVEVF